MVSIKSIINMVVAPKVVFNEKNTSGTDSNGFINTLKEIVVLAQKPPVTYPIIAPKPDQKPPVTYPIIAPQPEFKIDPNRPPIVFNPQWTSKPQNPWGNSGIYPIIAPKTNPGQKPSVGNPPMAYPIIAPKRYA